MSVKTGVQTAAQTMRGLLGAWKTAATEQKQQQIDQTTATQTAALEQNLADSAQAARLEQNQSEAEAARAMDNAALYAAARGDRGGIGAAQYQAIQAAALQNRARIRSAQSQLAADTARQIAQLRSQGEFQKADALLEVGQSYLSQLIKLEQWDAEFQNKQEQQDLALEQWRKNYELSRANVTGTLNEGQLTFAAQKYQQDRADALEKEQRAAAATLEKQQRDDQKQETKQQADAAALLLKAGVIPDETQLKALGLTSQQARSYIQSLVMYGKL